MYTGISWGKKSIFKVQNNKTLQFIVYLLMSDIWKHESSDQNESVKIKLKKNEVSYF